MIYTLSKLNRMMPYKNKVLTPMKVIFHLPFGEPLLVKYNGQFIGLLLDDLQLRHELILYWYQSEHP